MNKEILVKLLEASLLLLSIAFIGCSEREKIEDISQLKGKEFAIPTGTVADKLVLSKFPEAKFKYFNSVLDACIAVKSGKADAAAYDEPILKNIAAKNPGLKVLKDMITIDKYGFAVNPENAELKKAADSLINDLKSTGKYDEMLKRWLPESGSPEAMPAITLSGENGILKFGTSAVTEPFSFIDGTQEIVGLDIEIARLLAQKLGKELKVINMDFGAMIPALISNKVDMIGACITITEERAQKVLFTEPYYIGGIAALVRE
ncbi:MAG: transporter substrate-binding domain-containing protein [Melioribacteraceae bacterium]|nr:transporter substrate-binding domain-containing protein [Melioribacteraceae bacterium]MCF8356284.1 transporter substrate-binding domain-containing protein [Melioribacteraceae bacterium]MCF8394252.1 transporter substrate-binding domain-containing protein [Melioribacteraceae bacterium]MCF8419973.1 transporter substrate-binding domain-containing protein [Melioribacteraceae bacterium]